jgi:Fe-S-cluster containining protein
MWGLSRVLMSDCFTEREDGTFECRHYNEREGLCGIHDRKPLVCKNYHCGSNFVPDEKERFQ